MSYNLYNSLQKLWCGRYPYFIFWILIQAKPVFFNLKCFEKIDERSGSITLSISLADNFPQTMLTSWSSISLLQKKDGSGSNLMKSDLNTDRKA